MRLPQINYKSVESLALQRPDYRESEAIMAKSRAAQTGFKELNQALNTIGTLVNQRQARNIGNKNLTMADDLNRLTSQEFVNLNDPAVPQEVAAQIRVAQPDAQTVPSYEISDRLLEYYEKELKRSEDKLDGNQQKAIYDNFAGNAMAKAMGQVKSNVEMSIIRGIHNEYAERQQVLSSSGQIGEAIALGEEAVRSGVYTRDQQEAYAQNIIAKGQVMAGQQASDLTREATIAKYNQDENVAAAVTEDFNRFAVDMVQQGVWDIEEKNKQIKTFNQGMEKAAFQGELDDTYDMYGYESAQKYLDDSRGKPPENYTLDEWNSERSAFQSALNTRRENDRRFEADNTEAIQLQLDTNLVSTFAALRKPIVSKSERKSADNYYEAYNAQWGGVGSAQWLNKTMNLVNDTKYIPKGLQDQITGFILSEDPAAFTVGTQVYNLLKTDVPQVLKQVNTAEKAVLELGSRLQAAGTPLDKIPATANNLIYGVDDNVRGERMKAYAQQGDVNDRVADAADDLDPKFRWLWEKDPTVGNRFTSDYMALEKEYFAYTNDIEVAKQMALQDLKGTWGVSEANGKAQMMQFPVEATFGNYALDQFKAMKSAKFPDVDSNTIHLLSDGRTRNPQMGAQQSYALVQYDPNKPWEQVPLRNPDGTFARWTPDFSITQEYQDQQDQAAFQATSEEQVTQLFEDTWDRLMEIETMDSGANARQGTANRVERIVKDAYDKIEEMYPTQWKRSRAVNPTDPEIAERKKQMQEAVRKAREAFINKERSKKKSAPSKRPTQQDRRRRNRSPL